MPRPIYPIIFYDSKTKQKPNRLCCDTASNVALLLSVGHSIDEVAKMTGFDKQIVKDIKTGVRYPEIKEAYGV